MPHTCHAFKCETTCKPEFLMCPRHWRLVPRETQRAVYAAYRPGQCDDMNVSREWLMAAYTAIFRVAVYEGHMTEEESIDAVARRLQAFDNKLQEEP